MASCFFTSKWVYRVLTNFSPNPAKLKFRINWIKLDQNGSKQIKMDQINQNESRRIKMNQMDQDGSKWIKLDQN